MQSTELLHRFFDEGLEDSLEDVLFERMAVDTELRREFLQHQKLHSMIQEDVAGITTPSHVSQQLFIHLGLTPPANIAGPQPGVGRKIGAALAGVGSAIIRNRRYVITAAVSAFVTGLLFISLWQENAPTMREDGKQAPVVTTRTDEQSPSTTGSPQVTPMQNVQDEDGVTGSAVTAVPSSLSSASQSSMRPGRRTPVAGNAVAMNANSGSASGTSALNTEAVRFASAAPTVFPAFAQRETPSPMLLTSGTMEDATRQEEVLRGLVASARPVPFAEVQGEEPWHFFRPGPRENILSNVVFELQKTYGQSYPNVDLPHSSHNLFENMAISAVYKVTDHHAFGFEYGRENFGREYIGTAAPTLGPVDISMQELYTPPTPAMTETMRENRMLDVVGAVWKLSLPEYGMFHIVYPYMRTLVGASLLGPVSKVRVGLEMYPSNFSMLNIGVEGGVLRYTVDEATYYSSKLNVTVGVAIGF